MKEIKIIVDGKEIVAQISEESLRTLLPESKLTGFERSEHGREYYRALLDGKVLYDHDCNTATDKQRWEHADYYSNRSVAEWCAKADTLMRRIRRYAALQNVQVQPEYRKTYTLWRKGDGTFGVTSEPRYPFAPVFYSPNAASNAIKVFGGELNELYDNCPEYI